jgi:hypothetical protein
LEVVTASSITNILIGLVVLAFILYRQLQPRPVRDNFRLPLILGVVGVVELVEYLQHRPHGTGVIAALAGSLVIAAVFGAIRAATVRVWVDGGQAWRQGNSLTALLWVVSLAAHLGYDYIVDRKAGQSGLGSASLLLYFGVTFTIQRVILQARAQRIGPGNPAGPRNAGAPSPSAPSW